MPKVQKPVNLLEQLADLRERVATLERSGRVRDEVPFYATSLRTFVYEDATAFATLWETILTPRTATLALGLVFIGDVVAGTNTGGEWRVVLDDSQVVDTGPVPATFAYTLPASVIDLTPYRAASQLKVQIQVRRTSGATTGGRYGGGGSIGGGPRYARLL